MRRPLALAAVALSALLLTACSSEPEPLGSVTTVTELKDAFVSAGADCDDWAQGDATGKWAEFGHCGGSTGTILSTYASEVDKQSSVDGLRANGAGGQSLVGENWIITSDDDLSEYAAAMGGTIVKHGG